MYIFYSYYLIVIITPYLHHKLNKLTGGRLIKCELEIKKSI